jgi:hypothetical protein
VRWEVFVAIKRASPLQRPKLSLPYARLTQYAVLCSMLGSLPHTLAREDAGYRHERGEL